MYIKADVLNKSERLFLLSPLIVLLVAIFNFSDTKLILSRLIPIVSIYCLLRYREAFKENWHSELRGVFASGLFLFVLFSIYHALRGDAFSLPRTLITSLAYLFFVPWSKIPKSWLYFLVVVAAIICGLNAIYEKFLLDIPRVGIATNPIPYALYVSFLVLSCLFLFLKNSSKTFKLVASVGGLLSLSAIIMTDVRGVILFLPVVIFYLVVTTVRPTRKHFFVLFLSISAISSVFYGIFKQDIDARIRQTQYEISMIEKGNHNTSIGIRFDLWKRGVEVISQEPVFGLGDRGLQNSIASITNRGAAIQPHLHNQYFDFLARYGLVGSLATLILCLAFIVRIESGRLVWVSNPLINSMLMMLLLAGLTDVPLHHTHIIYLLVIFCGVLVRFSCMGKSQ